MTINYKPLEKNLEEGVNQLGSQIKGMPHIILGDKLPPKPSGQPQEATLQPELSGQTGIFNPKEQKIINTIKKWGLVLAVVLVCGYAVWRIVF